MAWNSNDQQYSSYGSYNDAQFYGAGQGDSSAYDMFEDSTGATGGESYGTSGAGGWDQNSYGGYYDPTSYQPQQSQTDYLQPPTSHPHPGGRGVGQSSKGPRGPTPPLLNPANLMGNPMVTDMAMQYGQDLVGRGQEELKKNLDKYVSIGQLKYYFAVDTNYVGKKIGLLLFPFTRTDWSLRYNADEPVQPKFDLNAPDLYIPTMAYVTYVLLVGYILGLKNAFSPDQLATTASTTLVWLILEIGLIYLTLTVMSINTNLTKWDILAFSSYKYVSMIAALAVGLLLQTRGYYIALVYLSAALAFFLLRTLKLRIEPEVHGMQNHGKRKLYMIMMYAAMQPLLIWWMTYFFVPSGAASIFIPGPETQETF